MKNEKSILLIVLFTNIDTSKISAEVVTGLDKEKVQLFDTDNRTEDNFLEQPVN